MNKETSKEMKTILITGCAGFIGVNLTKRLLIDPSIGKIIGIDNLCVSKYPPEELIQNQKFRFHQWDIVKNFEEIDRAFICENIDEIYHLASIASPVRYRLFPIDTLNVNVFGTRNMLEFAKRHNAKILLTSTSEVYGEPLVHPQPESYYGNVNTVGERSCYDESKRCAETYMYEYAKLGVDAKIVRIFNTYGPHMDIEDGRIIPSLLQSVIEEKELVVNGDGSQSRSYCYIDDMLDGLIQMMESSEKGPINLGNPYTECSVNELIRIIGKEVKVIYVDRRENDPLKRRPDINEAIHKLEFNPKIGLKEGLKKTLEFFLLHLKPNKYNR
jgi:UDP-glucuronate decarboxylase